MKNKRVFLLLLVLGLSCLGALAQTPIRIVLAAQSDDATVVRFKQALDNDIDLSERFIHFKGAPFDIPKNGIVLEIYSIPLSLTTGQNTGSAFVLIASKPSATERGYFKTVYAEQLTFGQDAQFSDSAQSFLAALRKQLTASP